MNKIRLECNKTSQNTISKVQQEFTVRHKKDSNLTIRLTNFYTVSSYWLLKITFSGNNIFNCLKVTYELLAPGSIGFCNQVSPNIYKMKKYPALYLKKQQVVLRAKIAIAKTAKMSNLQLKMKIDISKEFSKFCFNSEKWPKF